MLVVNHCSHSQSTLSDVMDQIELLFLVTVRGVNSKHELQGSRIQLLLLTLQISLEMFSHSYVLVVHVKIVYVLSIYSPHYLQALFASLYPLLRDHSSVAEILTHS